LSLVISDYSHYAVHNGYLYIYKTPDTANYTISIIGVNLPDEKTVSETFEIGKRLGMALCFKALSFIADLNGSENESNRFDLKAQVYERKLKKVSQDENTNTKDAKPYNMFNC